MHYVTPVPGKGINVGCLDVHMEERLTQAMDKSDESDVSGGGGSGGSIHPEQERSATSEFEMSNPAMT